MLFRSQLAHKANLATSCIAMLETNKREPTANTLISLSNALNVSTDYLLGLEDDFGSRTAAPMGESLSEKEKALLQAFRKLLPETQDFVLRAVGLNDQKLFNKK